MPCGNIDMLESWTWMLIFNVTTKHIYTLARNQFKVRRWRIFTLQWHVYMCKLPRTHRFPLSDTQASCYRSPSDLIALALFNSTARIACSLCQCVCVWEILIFLLKIHLQLRIPLFTHCFFSFFSSLSYPSPNLIATSRFTLFQQHFKCI